MSKKTAMAGVILSRIVSSAAAGLLSYFLILWAFRPYSSSLETLSEYEHYLAGGLAVLVFLIILHRTFNGSWSRDHVDQLMNTDDTSV